MTRWTPQDVADLAARGHDEAWADAQMAALAKGSAALRVHRAATKGDGIRVLDDGDWGRLEAAHDQAARDGRVSSFVPASGAATRLCATLRVAFEQGIRDAADPRLDAKTATLLRNLSMLAVWDTLEEHGALEDDAGSILDAMFGPDGVRLDDVPKGLVPFHAAPDGARTAFDEQLVEALRLGRDARGHMRAHFTVGEAHREAFQAALAATAKRLSPRSDVVMDVSFSVQDPATDTLASNEQGDPFRTDDGRLLFRPGGHGALLRNLAATRGDLVLVKNIDNVVPEDLRGPNLPWRRRLGGLLVELQAEAWVHVHLLRDGRGIDAAVAFCRTVLGREVVPEPAALLAQLHRPWRVCGMVPNSGQPGGGPFWADSPDGVSLQIVEGAQIDTSDAAQAAVLGAATHFNPVDMALGLRDADGKAFDLTRFTDPAAAIVARKHHGCRMLRALEHPGLWNGGMARWNTVFVEIPSKTFQPVKALDDLLTSGHGGPLC